MSIRNRRFRVSEVGKASNYVRNLEAGNHGIFFYRNPHEKHEVLFNFLEAGLQKGEGAVYVSSQETSKQIRRHMEDFGLDVKSLCKEGTLRIFDYDEWYIIDGEVNIPHMKMMGEHVFHEAMEIGLKGVRGCGEAACFFDNEKEKALVEYELAIGRKFDLPLITLCAYDVKHAKSLKDKFFLGLIKAHGPVVTLGFTREVKFEKFFPTILNEVLENVFGETGRDTILRLLAERYSVTLDRIAEDPMCSIEGLERLVGSSAEVITSWVVTQMHSKIGIAGSANSSGLIG